MIAYVQSIKSESINSAETNRSNNHFDQICFVYLSSERSCSLYRCFAVSIDEYFCLIMRMDFKFFWCDSDGCPVEYYSIDPNHSYCSPIYPDVIERPVTDTERDYILRAHNNERELLRSTNMQKMVIEYICCSLNSKTFLIDWIALEWWFSNNCIVLCSQLCFQTWYQQSTFCSK